MMRTRWLVVFGFVVALAAGVVLGVVQDRARHQSERGSWLAAQLDLSPDQQEQIKQIWSEVASRTGREHREQREALLRERDERVRAMLGEEQRARYDAIVADYARQIEDLSRERSRAVDEAIERTKALLTDSQRERYEQLLREREHWPLHKSRAWGDEAKGPAAGAPEAGGGEDRR